MELTVMASKAIDNKSSRIHRGLESTPVDQLKISTTTGISSYGFQGHGTGFRRPEPFFMVALQT
jgi:hypothetical protein